MKRNKHLLLWSSIGALALLIVAAADENFTKEWRTLQRKAKASGAAPDFDVRLRQIFIPQLAVTDRCVSCHVGMAPGETAIANDAVLGAHPPVVHDPADYGCTACHAGQGRATEKADAHGRVEHWPEPMIPIRDAEAGCGACHTHLAVPHLALLHQGEVLFERYDCLACHRLDGRGGTLRPAGVGMEGPDLSLVGMRGYDARWYEKHLAKRSAEPGSLWSTSFGPIPENELEPIAVLLGSRVGAPKLVEAKALFHSLGCRGCHRIGGVGGDDGPDLTHEGERDPGQLDFSRVPGTHRDLGAWFSEHFRAPSSIVPGSQMPALGLTEDQIDLLTLYMFSLRRSEFPEAYWPKDRILATRFGEREYARDGETLFGTFCAACHGPAGQGMRYAGMPAFPAIANPGFLSLATDQFMAETVRRGRPGRRMPAWGSGEGGLGPEDITKVVAYVRQLGGGVLPSAEALAPLRIAGTPVAGKELFGRYCASCHGAGGEGGEGPALANPVLLETASDRYLFETILRGRPGTSMEGFGTPSPTRPTLTEAEIASVVAYVRTLKPRR